MTRDQFGGVSEQTKASSHRRADAGVLFDGQRWHGAKYMAGYAVECLLKAKMMKMYQCQKLSELDDELKRRNLLSENDTIFTHHLESLLRLADGRERLRQNIELWKEFNIVNRWVPAWRYSPDPSNSDDAGTYLNAVDRILRWVENNT